MSVQPLAFKTTGNVVTVPLALTWLDDRPLITFGQLPIAAFDRPFLDETLAAATIVGFAPLDSLPDDPGPVRLAGMIHHMSRCGSTLLVRQFSALPRVVVLSEPFMFQHLLEGPAAPHSVTQQRLRILIATWCRALVEIADRLVIKWPSLLSQHGTAITSALPKVPTLFLHREPVEVLASIVERPLGGLQHVRPHHLYDASRAAAPVAMADLEIGARVLARSCRAAASIPALRRLDYTALPTAGWDSVAPYFGLSLSNVDTAAMRTASIPHSKYGLNAPFNPDTFARRETKDPCLRELAERFVAPALAELVARVPPVSALFGSPADLPTQAQADHLR